MYVYSNGKQLPEHGTNGARFEWQQNIETKQTATSTSMQTSTATLLSLIGGDDVSADTCCAKRIEENFVKKSNKKHNWENLLAETLVQFSIIPKIHCEKLVHAFLLN